MAHYSSVFSRVPIELPNRSGFDMSHENMGTQTCGTLIPVMVDELLPNDTVSLGANFQVQLPPMASDFYGKVDYVLEAFFVPSRLLWGGWKSFMTHPTANPVYPSGTPVQGRSKYIPQLYLDSIGVDSYARSGSLADFLGFRLPPSDSQGLQQQALLNILPFVAYHRIWDDWYRDSRIQAPLFYSPDRSVVGSAIEDVRFLPEISGSVDSPMEFSPTQGRTVFDDGVNIMELRQRNWAKDYFTTASTLPQAGQAATVEVEIADNQGVFSIASLRAANSLQKWMERNNIAGYRYSDQIYVQYGVYPSDAIMDKVIYLGRTSENVYTRSVFQTAKTSENNPNNHFNGVASKYGSSQAVGGDSIVDSIRVTEHGFLFVMASLVPRAIYSTGMRRYMKRRVVGDIAFPLLSGMGDQAIMKSELDAYLYGTGNDSEFGYTDLYAEYKYHDDEVHGLLRDGETLQAYALQRGFYAPDGEGVSLSSAFLLIPKDYLKQVMAVSNKATGFDAWYDIYFSYKKVSTLPEYSTPTLADLKHAHTEYVSRGGKRL